MGTHGELMERQARGLKLLVLQAEPCSGRLLQAAEGQEGVDAGHTFVALQKNC